MNFAVATHSDLHAVLTRCREEIDAATTCADILVPKLHAQRVYDEASRAIRFAKAKGAHDDLVASAHRLKADALEIEAQAARKLADEYDAAQERGEIASRGGERSGLEHSVPPPTIADAGLTRKEIFEARKIRDAEEAEPGIVRATIDGMLERGEEPTRAALKREIASPGFIDAAPPAQERTGLVNRTSFTGNNEWFTPQEHIDRARLVLGGIDLDPASHEVAQARVQANAFFTEEDDGLAKEWFGRVWLNPPYAQPAIGQFVDKMVGEVEAQHVQEAIMLTHNYTDTAWFQKAARAASAICFTRGRIRFVSPSGELAAPTQGQAFFYFGHRSEEFQAAFREIGFVVEVVP